MNRSEAATTLFRWQFEGERELVRAAGGDRRPLVSIVEDVAGTRPNHAQSPHSSKAPPPTDFLQLEEEKMVERLRAQLRALGPALGPRQRAALERRLRDLMPTAVITALYQEVERLGGHVTLPKESPPTGPPTLRSLLLFSRDGRLLASEGSIALDVAPFSALVVRGEPGTTWRLGHQAGIVIGHVGERAGLVAVFSAAPKSAVRSTLRASIASLEQKERLVNVLSHPSSHATLMAYLRGVGALLRQHT